MLNSSIRFLKYTGSLRDTQSRTRGSKKPRSSGASLNRYAIRWSFVETLLGSGVPFILPSNDSVYSALLSLHGVPRDGSPASSVQWIATTPCRPSPRTSFPSFGGYRGGAHLFAPTGGRRRAPVSLDIGLPVPTGVVAAETTGPPRFLGEPPCVHALLFDPGRPILPGLFVGYGQR